MQDREQIQADFIGACKSGDIQTVQSLMNDGCDVSANNNEPIQTAARCGHLEVVKFLLINPHVDPAANDNYAIKSAAGNGYHEVVKLLLADRRVDPSAEINFAITSASINGHHEVVRLLLTNPRVDPSDRNNSAIRDAAGYGHVEIVKLLLADRRVDPTADNNYAIRSAVGNGHVEVVKLLSADHRVASSVDINAFIQRATQNNHVEVVNFLKTKRDTDAAIDSAALYLDVQPVPASHFMFLKFLKLCGVFLLSAVLLLAAGGLIGGLFGVWPDINAFFEAIHLVTDWGIGVAAAAGGLALGITNMVGWKAYGDVSLNPFAGIIETDASPHARTLRTGFAGKVKDACMVFFGNSKDGLSQFVGIRDDRSPEHFGLLDGATLFLSGSIEKLMKKAVGHSNPLIKLLGGILLLVTIPLWIARLALTAVLVFNPFSLFIIGLVHLASQHPYGGGGAELKWKVVSGVKALVFPQLEGDSARPNPGVQDFINYPNEERQSAVDSLRILPYEQNKLALCKRVHLGLAGEDSSDRMTTYMPSIFASNPLLTNQRGFEKALLELNCGDITRELEKSSDELSQKALLGLLSTP